MDLWADWDCNGRHGEGEWSKLLLISLALNGHTYTTEASLSPSSDQSTLTNPSIGLAARERMFMRDNVGVAGFIDHVKSLAYCARPFTIEHLETYRRTQLAFRDIALNTPSRSMCVGIPRLGTYADGT